MRNAIPATKTRGRWWSVDDNGPDFERCDMPIDRDYSISMLTRAAKRRPCVGCHRILHTNVETPGPALVLSALVELTETTELWNVVWVERFKRPSMETEAEMFVTVRRCLPMLIESRRSRHEHGRGQTLWPEVFATQRVSRDRIESA